MGTTAYIQPGSLLGSSLPKVWKPAVHGFSFGDVAILAFLLAQCLDGVFTYVGVMTFGIGVEANPVIAALMVSVGHGSAILVAKCVAAMLGICLHLFEIHTAVAALASFYLTVAVLPWVVILVM